MSSEQGMEFGEEFEGEYEEFLEDWIEGLTDIALEDMDLQDEIRQELDASIRVKWGKELEALLGAPIAAILIEEVTRKWITSGLLPSLETIQRFAQIATKISLSGNTLDLLGRLFGFVTEAIEVTGNIATIAEALRRTAQTVAQIFDDVEFLFNDIMARYNKRKGNLTDRRRWQVTDPRTSRHRRLHNQIRKENQFFRFKGENIYGPRPFGGEPEDWSNCSCYLEYETPDGDWI